MSLIQLRRIFTHKVNMEHFLHIKRGRLRVRVALIVASSKGYNLMKVVHFPNDASNAFAEGETIFGIHWIGDRVVHAGFQNHSDSLESLAGPQSYIAPNRTSSRGEKLSVSVVICTRDRPQHLETCLSSMPLQTRIPDEVIVVDNASADERTRVVAETAGVTYVREDRPGLDIARNTGANAAKSDVVVYTDDDTVLHKNWLENIVHAFDNETIVAVTGLVLPLRLDTLAQQIFESHWSFGRGFEPIDFGPSQFQDSKNSGFEAWNIGAGANMAFRRSVFETYGFFDESLDVGASGCSGDSEFWYRIIGLGGTCRYDPACVVFHDHRETEEGLRKQLRAYMCGHVTALRVQAQRFPNHGNLTRLYRFLPAWYFGRIWQRIKHGRSIESWFLIDEIRGYIDGLFYPLGRARDSVL